MNIFSNDFKHSEKIIASVSLFFFLTFYFLIVKEKFPHLFQQIFAGEFPAICYGGIEVLLIAPFFYTGWTVANRDRKNQQEYYNISRIHPLNDQQKSALQLTIFDSFEKGMWSETLEEYPLRDRIPDYVLEDFYNFPMADKIDVIEYLYESWNTYNKQTYYKNYKKLISNGDSSEKFLLDYVFREDGLDEFSVRYYIPRKYLDIFSTPRKNKPAMLAWGFDIWQAAKLTRLAYMADYISEDEAWENLYQLSDYAHTLFDSLADYQYSSLIGFAVWAQEREKMHNKLSSWQYYQQYCDFSLSYFTWEEKDLPLLPAMENIFEQTKKLANKQKTEYAEEQTSKMGFI